MDAIVGAVLDEHGVKYEKRLSAAHAPREYTVQYHETDYAFVTRLMAEEGLAFWFEHASLPAETPATREPVTEVAVVTDAVSGYVAAPSPLTFRPPSGVLGSSDGFDVTSLRRLAKLEPTAATARRYDFERAAPTPGKPIVVTPNAGPTFAGGVASVETAGDGRKPGSIALEWYEAHGFEHGLTVTDALSRRKLEQLRTLSDTTSLVTHARFLGPGVTFDVANQDVMTDTSVVLRAVHWGSTEAGVKMRYEAKILAAPATVLGRAPIPPRRNVQTVESGVVVGAIGKEIDTDALGRVRVQFTWDRIGKNDDSSSCWLRVVQPWSGSRYGFQFIPRVGTEVLVAFLGGDPDRPVVTGCLPNASNALPFTLPDEVTRSGIRSQSTPQGGGNYNEISFDDNAGKEVLYFHAAKNHEVVVAEDHTARVGGAQTTSVGGDAKLLIGGDYETRFKGGSVAHVAGDSGAIVSGGLSASCAKDRVAAVGGSDKVTVAGTAHMQTGGEYILHAGVKSPSNLFILSSAESRIVGAECVRLFSPKSIAIQCGDSTMTVGPDGITIQGKALNFIATDSINVTREPTALTIKDKVELRSDQITLETDMATLLMTKTDMKLQAASVSIAGPQGVTRTAKPGDPPPTLKGKFQIKRPEGFTGPITAVVALPTGEVVEKQVDASGEVSLDGYAGDRFRLVEVRLGNDKAIHGLDG